MRGDGVVEAARRWDGRLFLRVILCVMMMSSRRLLRGDLQRRESAFFSFNVDDGLVAALGEAQRILARNSQAPAVQRRSARLTASDWCALHPACASGRAIKLKVETTGAAHFKHHAPPRRRAFAVASPSRTHLAVASDLDNTSRAPPATHVLSTAVLLHRLAILSFTAACPFAIHADHSFLPPFAGLAYTTFTFLAPLQSRSRRPPLRYIPR